MMFELFDTGILAAWPVWAVQLVWALITTAVGMAIAYWTRDTSGGPEAAKFNELELPSNSQGTDPPAIWGTPARSKGLMILWYGVYATHKTKVHDTTVNILYYLAVHGGLSLGNIDGVLQWWAEETCVAPTLNNPNAFAADQTTEFTIYAQDIWGGRKRGGGVGGKIEILYGSDSQEMNHYLNIFQSGYTGIPGYRGITSAVFKGYFNASQYTFYWGVSPKLPMMSPVLKRTNRLHDGSSQWYVAKAVIGTTPCDINPIHMLRELFTSKVCGAGKDTSLFDETSWQAAADTIYTEGTGVSYRWHRSSEPLKELIKKLYDIINGFVYFDESTATYKVKLIREDYVVGNLETFDNHDFEILTAGRPTTLTTASQTIVWYTDRTTTNRTPAIEDDTALAERQGDSRVVQEFEWPMIHNPDTALALAAREQKEASAMPAAFSLSCKRTMHALMKGDVFIMEHPRLVKAGIASMVVRVIKKNRGTLENGEIQIDVMEEIFSAASVTYVPTPGSDWTSPTEDHDEEGGEVVGGGFDEWTGAIINETVV